MTEHLYAWYAARLLYVSEIDGVEDLFEERVILLRAEHGEAAAMKKAKKIGKAEAHSYKNIDSETVSWIFREVLDLIQLDTNSIQDGTEVYHHFLTADEVEQVRASLKTGSLA